jgi:hypothetical protein
LRPCLYQQNLQRCPRFVVTASLYFVINLEKYFIFVYIIIYTYFLNYRARTWSLYFSKLYAVGTASVV